MVKKKYIEIEAAKKAMCGMCEGGAKLVCGTLNDCCTTMRVFDSIPAADVREVVYCRDCKCYRQSSFIDKHMECARSGFPVHAVDFCSFGEKREKSWT